MTLVKLRIAMKRIFTLSCLKNLVCLRTWRSGHSSSLPTRKNTLKSSNQNKKRTASFSLFMMTKFRENRQVLTMTAQMKISRTCRTISALSSRIWCLITLTLKLRRLQILQCPLSRHSKSKIILLLPLHKCILIQRKAAHKIKSEISSMKVMTNITSHILHPT